MTDTIVVRGISAEGMHGLEGEREQPQPFLVDVEITVDLAAAAAADRIEATIDYSVVSSEVRDIVMNESFELIETLADAIAARLLALGASSVRVKVSKPKVARTLHVDEIAVVIER